MSAPDPQRLEVEQGGDQQVHAEPNLDEAGRVGVGETRDPVELGLLIGNAISAAVFGVRGEFRERQDELTHG